MPKVSVIIPSYNHEKYVAEAIQSVLDQTYQDFEIVVTDDGSTDKTVEVIKQFSDSRIKLFVFEENQGACIAANHCIKNAVGEFISLLNSDDAYKPHKLEKQINFLDKNPEIGAVFSYPEFIDEDSQLITKKHFYQTTFQKPNRTRFEWLNYFFYNGNCICHPTILIRKECYDIVGLYDPRYAQLPDFDFWIRLCQKYDIHIMPEELIKFRIRNNEANVSSRKPQTHVRISSEIYQIYQNYLNLEVLENLTTIFPEVKQFKNFEENQEFNREICQYFIAKLALETEFNSIHCFGINLLFQLLKPSNSINSEKLHNLISYKELIKITGSFDPFREKREQQLIAILKDSQIFRLRQAWLRIKSRLGIDRDRKLF